MNKLIVAALLAVPLMASATEGEVCIARSVQANNLAHRAVTNETRFECLTAGKDTTIPDLYKRGWKVASVFPQMIQDESTGLQLTRWTIVVEKI